MSHDTLQLSMVLSSVPPIAAAVHILLRVTQGQLESQNQILLYPKILQGLWDHTERLHIMHSNHSAVGADMSRFRIHMDHDHISQQRNIRAQLSTNVFGKGMRICLLSQSKLGRSRKAGVLWVLILGLCVLLCQLLQFYLEFYNICNLPKAYHLESNNLP